jgi:ABC-type uncharacterized transport system permease subunit
MPFLLTLFLQILVCFKTQHLFWKVLPFIIDLIAFIYAGARFFGIFSYKNDTQGIYDHALTDAISISTMATAALIGIIIAWLTYFLIKLFKDRKG